MYGCFDTILNSGTLPMLPPAGSRTTESGGGAQDRSSYSASRLPFKEACLVEDMYVTQD
jgi:hypothetical protein